MDSSSDRLAWAQTIPLTPPSLGDNTADADRLATALKHRLNAQTIVIDLALLQRLPLRLRAAGFAPKCVLAEERGGWRLLEIMPTQTGLAAAGLAVDLGTSRVVLRLIDLASGGSLGEAAFDNPQAAVGPEILSRVHAADSAAGLAHQQNLIIDGLNRHIGALCRAAGLVPTDIFAVAVAGNTAMTHLLMGLPPHWIIREPYIPVVNKPDSIAASDLGLTANPAARVLVLPNIGSYVGGDVIAGVRFAGLAQASGTAILVDVGTNAEVVIGNDQWLMACAGAAGPALEGGVTRMGTTAAPGVIDRVRIEPASLRFDLHTIAERPPTGICGSGLIDLAAHLFQCGLIDPRGKFVPSRCGPRLVEIAGEPHLTILGAAESGTGEDLTIGQADLDSLVRSKAAMYTILETVTAGVGIDFGELAAFYVAGTFGSFIDPKAAITIGMLPDLPLERFRPLGNSSLEGACLVLAGKCPLSEMDRIRDRITYLELNVNQDFMNRFSAAKFIPHTDLSRFPSVKPPLSQ